MLAFAIQNKPDAVNKMFANDKRLQSLGALATQDALSILLLKLVQIGRAKE